MLNASFYKKSILPSTMKDRSDDPMHQQLADALSWILFPYEVLNAFIK